MSEISLRVTHAVLAHAQAERANQRQIAYTDASLDIAPRLAALTAQDRARLLVGESLTVVVGDRGAIWHAHNAAHANDFDALFEFLARHPERPVRFLCRLLG